MSKINKAIFFLVILIIAFSNLAVKDIPNTTEPELVINDATKVWDVMSRLGKVNVNNVFKSHKPDANKGQQLVMYGSTTNEHGKKTPHTSHRKLTCAACHTTQPEHPDAKIEDPQKRLEHGDSVGIPFLPGAPFYGLVNRIAFFTDDYQKSFSHKEKEALVAGQRDIRKAIQACNLVYAKGRKLQSWEIESILAFLWTLELKMGDLALPDKIIDIVKHSIETSKANSKAVNMMRRYYFEVYPATLARPMPIGERKKVSPILNSFTNGRTIYRQSCLHCHANKRFSKYKLDKRQKTFKFLKKHLDLPSRHSIYDAIRYNPGSKGNKSLTPHYTTERMSDQQIQDLRFYINQMARLGNRANAYYDTPAKKQEELKKPK